MKDDGNRAIRVWVAIGLLAYVALPWYAQQDMAWYQALPKVLGGSDTASGVVQAILYGRKWLLLGFAGLVMVSVGIGQPPGAKQSNWLLAGGLVGILGLAGSAFLIGANGWTVDAFNAQFGALAGSQVGLGAGGFVALVSLAVLTGFGLARHGFFKGSLLIAGSVLGFGIPLVLFIALR